MGRESEGKGHVLSFIFLSFFVVYILPLFNNNLIDFFYLGSCFALFSEQ